MRPICSTANLSSRNLGRWVQLVANEAKSLASDNGTEVDGSKKPLLNAEAAKGMREVPANCCYQAAETVAESAAEPFLNSLLLAYDLTTLCSVHLSYLASD